MCASSKNDGHEEVLKIIEYCRGLGPRDALRAMQDPNENFSSMVKTVLRFSNFPVVKARFNAFPATPGRIKAVSEALGSKSKRETIDTVLGWMLEKLPKGYWDERQAIEDLLGNHLPASENPVPLSFAMGGLGYSLIQDLGEVLGIPQGAILDAALGLWLEASEKEKADLQSVTPQLLEVLTKIEALATELKKLSPKDSDGLDVIAHAAEEAHSALSDRLEKPELAGKVLRPNMGNSEYLFFDFKNSDIDYWWRRG
jgi:hypothetical protein